MPFQLGGVLPFISSEGRAFPLCAWPYCFLSMVYCEPPEDSVSNRLDFFRALD
jgi:hypothetical protein